MNSDGTVYFSTDEDSAGRIATQRFAKQHNKPFLLNPTSQELAQWLVDNNIGTLNVAGNRGSKVSPEFDSQVRDTIRNAFSSPIQQDLFASEQSSETINIYAGTGENADLSNFAVRPFTISGDKSESSIRIGGNFQTVEGAFQAQKLVFSSMSDVVQQDLFVEKLKI